MPSFKTKYDIVNRGLQHCRVELITSFADQSRAAKETQVVYERLREAELQQDYWRFSIREVISRAIDANTVLWTPPAYNTATTYAAPGLVVVDSNGDWWEAKQATTGNDPDDASPFWSHYVGPDHMDPFLVATPLTMYFTGELVLQSGTVYRCLTFGATTTPPSSDWLAMGGTTAALQILYPLGAGPLSQTTTQNVFRLPHGYLRKAPPQQKGGINPPLGVPSSNFMDDHVYENSYFTSTDAGPALQRIVADVEDVMLMSPMFCEMLGARIAEEVAPTLAEKDLLPTILKVVNQHYKDEHYKAVAVNAIEQEAPSPTEDDYITCRY